MKLSTFNFKWMMRLYPPLLCTGIWVKNVTKDYKEVDVRIYHHILNNNIQGSIFGGTLFNAADPFFALMMWQICALKGIKTEQWSKKANISYIKPAKGRMTLNFRLSDSEIEELFIALDSKGKYIHKGFVDVKNKQGEICASIEIENYIRLKR